MSGKWAISGFAIFIGTICLIYRLVMGNKLKKQMRTSGRIVSSIATSREGSGFKTIFAVANHAEGEVECTVQTNHAYEVDETVPVLHPPKFPSHATIYEPFIHKLFGTWILYGMIALLFVAQMGWIPED